MENVATKYFEGEKLDFAEEIDGIDEIEEEKPVIDEKTKRKACFIKRRRAMTRSAKKSKLSAIAQKKKKEEERKNLGASIISKRKATYNALRAKRGLAACN